jgi:cytochrome c oxidase cbb3-type subunit 3
MRGCGSSFRMIVALLATTGVGVAQQKAPDASAVARGRAQFTKTCSFCHGADATGGPEGPNLTLAPTVRHDVNGDLIGAVIREGRPARGMPPFPLQPDQIADVVAYLHARVTELDRRSAGKPPSSYGLENLLTGDAAKGKMFFDGVGHCTQCHSVTGDLAGIAKKYPPVELQARFLYPPEVEQTATVTPKTGRLFKAWWLRRCLHHFASRP